MSHFHVIVVGTDPSSGSGGIANALPAYLESMDSIGVTYDFVRSHHPTERAGKWKHWLACFGHISRLLKGLVMGDSHVVAYLHMGGGVFSIARKSILAVYFKLMHIPVAIQLHGAEVSTYVASPCKRFLFKIALSPASIVCVLTQWWSELLTSHAVGGKIAVISNPIGARLAAVAATTPVRHHTKAKVSVVAIARLVPGKGLELLIDALVNLPDNIEVTIAGSGVLLEELQYRAVERGVSEKIVFSGWIEGDAKHKLLLDADIFCLPSSYESFGLSYIEAMAYGLPVIALDYGPVRDVVPDGVCGLLMKQANPESLADAIRELANENDLRFKLGSSARNWVLSTFGIEVIGKDILSMLKAVR